MRYLFLVMILVIFNYSCLTSFESGKYYDKNDQDTSMPIQYLFFDNGEFRIVTLKPGGVQRLLEAGKWKKNGNLIEMRTDSILLFNGSYEKRTIVSFFRQRLFCRSELVLKKILNGKKNRTVIKREKKR